MNRLWDSVAFRLAIGYGALALSSTLLISAVFYFGTVGVVAHRADAKLQVLSNRLVEHYGSAGAETVRHDLEQLLSDGIDQDTEVYELIGPDGQIIAGNLAGWTPLPAEAGKFEDRGVIRNGQPSVSRLLPVVLADGAIIVVGRDLHDQFEIERIVWRALGVGAMGALALAVLGAFMFRRKLEQRIAAIRRTAHAIEAGDMSRRVPNSGGEDEFALLGGDINRMLDRIEHLMEGVRHVSNAIAHDLRTPLARLRNMLDEAIRAARGTELPAAAARSAIAQIDNVIQIFDRLLQIAEAESGTRRGSFASVRLAAVIADVVELYDAEAEAREIALLTDVDESAMAFGDRDLLASAVANLVDNALKYAGERTIVRVCAAREQGRLCVIVEDNGPGIPAQERGRVVERFYRLDASRTLPGNGLGLSIVGSVASLHGGSLRLEESAPGLRAVLFLPEASAAPAVTPASEGVAAVAS